MTIELCRNSEWWRVFGPFDEAANDGLVDAAVCKVIDELDAAGVEWVYARGQRSTCHGWNGAKTFARLVGGIGGGESISDDEWAVAEDAYFRGVEAGRKLIESSESAD